MVQLAKIATLSRLDRYSLPINHVQGNRLRMRYKRKLKLTAVSVCLGLLVSGCGPSGQFTALSEAELRAELTACNNIANPSNRKAIACGNFRRECESRMERDGKFRNC